MRRKAAVTLSLSRPSLRFPSWWRYPRTGPSSAAFACSRAGWGLAASPRPPGAAARTCCIGPVFFCVTEILENLKLSLSRALSHMLLRFVSFNEFWAGTRLKMPS